MEFPGNHIPAVPVDEGYKIHKAFSSTDVGNVGAPYVVWVSSLHASQQVWIYRMAWMWLAGVRFWIDGLQSQLGHEPSDTFSAHMDVVPDFRKLVPHSQFL